MKFLLIIPAIALSITGCCTIRRRYHRWMKNLGNTIQAQLGPYSLAL